MKDIKLGDVIELKKGHACGANKWEIIRFGADLKLKCLNCERVVMLPRIDVRKRTKKILNRDE